jgi:predicted dehydrogenase
MNVIPLAIAGLRFGRHVIQRIATGEGRHHVRVAAVCDLDGSLAARTGAELGVPAFASLDDLLADPAIPGIGLFTPPAGRSALVRRCLAAGKHVMTTKPFDLDSHAAAEVLAEARRLGRVVHLNSPSPSPADLAQIQEWIHEHDLGQPVAARAEMLTSAREEADGSWYDDPLRCPLAPVFRLGIYLINDLLTLFGPAAQVFAQGERLRTGRPTPDQGQISLRFRNGGLGSIYATYCCDDGDRYLSGLLLHCERGTIYRNLAPDLTWQSGPFFRARLDLVMGNQHGRRHVATRHIDRVSGEYEWAAFATACREGRPLDEATCNIVVEGIRVVEAMGRSEQSAAPVDLPELK